MTTVLDRLDEFERDFAGAWLHVHWGRNPMIAVNRNELRDLIAVAQAAHANWTGDAMRSVLAPLLKDTE
jgi:hypothetical protein